MVRTVTISGKEYVFLYIYDLMGGFWSTYPLRLLANWAIEWTRYNNLVLCGKEDALAIQAAARELPWSVEHRRYIFVNWYEGWRPVRMAVMLMRGTSYQLVGEPIEYHQPDGTIIVARDPRAGGD